MDSRQGHPLLQFLGLIFLTLLFFQMVLLQIVGLTLLILKILGLAMTRLWVRIVQMMTGAVF